MDEKTRRKMVFLVNTAYYIIIGLMVYLGFKYVASWVMPFIVAFCIVSVIHPLVKKINLLLKIKHEIVAVAVMILIYLTLGYGVVVLSVWLVRILWGWFAGLPAYYENTIAPTLYKTGIVISDFVKDIPFTDEIDFSGLSSELLSAAQGFIVSFSQRGVSIITGFSSQVPAFFISFVFTIMLSFFISTRYNEVVRFIRSQLPEKAQGFLSDLKAILMDTVYKYIKAIGKLITITFIELSIGLYVLGMDNPIGTAAGIAVFDALPVFGTGGIMVPWVIIELAQANYTLSLGLLILYGLVTFIRNIIEPKIVGDQLGLNPVVSLIVIYLGYKLFGVLGMIFMPIAAQVLLALHKNGNIKLYKNL